MIEHFDKEMRGFDYNHRFVDIKLYKPAERYNITILHEEEW